MSAILPPGTETRRVGVVLEKRKLDNPWIDHAWRPVQILPGVPEAPPWTLLGRDEKTERWFVGAAELVLYRRESESYIFNLRADAPAVFVVLRRVPDERGIELIDATVCAAEATARSDAGEDMVDSVPMPDDIRDWVAAFVDVNPPTTEYKKRKRDKANPEALARRTYLYESDPLRQMPEDE